MPKPWHLWYWRSLWGSWRATKARPQLLTVDVFDTILRRTCHPQEIKFLTARRLWLEHLSADQDLSPWDLFTLRRGCEGRLAEHARQQGCDGEYKLLDVVRAWLNALLPDWAPEEREQLVVLLARGEWEFERGRTRLDPHIGRCLESWANAPCAIASDFYMPSEWVGELLAAKGFSRPLEKIYVSHDFCLSKSTGRLFTKIREDLGVPAAGHLHVGDLFESDILPQRKAGGMACWYRGSQKERKRIQFLRHSWEHRQQSSLAPHVTRMRRLWAGLAPAVEGPRERRLFAEGRELALLVGPLVLFILEEAARERTDEIWYFTREGELLAAAHEVLATAGVLGMDLPRPRLLEVSRQSTFLATLRRGSLEEMQPFWAMYPRHCLETLCTSFNLKLESFLPVVKRLGLDADAVWDRPWEAPEFLALWDDREFKTLLLDAAKRQREELLAYFAGQGITNEPGRDLFVVDIGWRGSIQDNLAKVLDKVFWSGRYLGLQKFLSPQLGNAKKAAFGPDHNQKTEAKDLLEYVSPLEMVFNSPRGSVSGYRGVVNPEVLRVVGRAEEEVYERYTRHLQKGLLAALEVFGRVVMEHGLTSAEFRPIVLETWRRLVQRPPVDVARAYFQLRHNELFGMGTFVDKNQPFPYGRLVASAFSARARHDVNHILRESGWPQGYLAASGLGALNPLFNWRKCMSAGRGE